MIIQFIIFAFASIVSFFLPGFLVVSAFRLKSKPVNILLSYVFGIIMWAMQGVMFGYLGIRWFTYLYLGLIFIFSIVRYGNNFVEQSKNIPLKIIIENKITFLLIFLGIIVQLIPVAGSGLILNKGMVFFGNSAFDGLTHLGFIQTLMDHFPPVEPGVYNMVLRNYHYLADLVIAEFSRIWKIPISLLLFQFFPLFVSFFTGIGTYLAVRSFGGSKKMANWMIFLLCFAGDGAYIIVLILHKTLSFNTPGIDNGATQFLNMPNAMAKMIFITALIPLQNFITSNKKTWGLLSVLFLAPLVGFKIYFGIFCIFGFSLVIFKKLICRLLSKKGIVMGVMETIKKEWFSLCLLLLYAGIVLAIYLPANGSAGGLFYVPLEWPKSLLGAGSIDWQDWWLRMQVYQAHGNYRDIYILDAIAIIIALISIHGTRLLGFWPSKKLFKFLGWEKALFLIPGLFLFHFLGLYTLQVTGGLNIFNFFVVGTVVLSLLSAFILADLSESRNTFAKVFLIIFVLLTVPRVIYEVTYSLNNYKTGVDSYTISSDELSAMKYIDTSTAKDAVVQSSPGNEKDYRVGYLSTFSKRLTYLTGVVFTQTRNQKIADKEIALEQLFNSNDAQQFVKSAKDKNIQYIYLQKNPKQLFRFSLDNTQMKTVYQNKSIEVIKII